MYNLLIVEDNPDYLKNFINIISEELPNIKVNYVTFDATDTFKILDKQSIDIILLDLKLPNRSGFSILKHIVENNLYKYKNSIIAISAELDTLSVLKYRSYLFSYHFKNVDYASILESLRLLVDEKNNASILLDVRNKIHNELKFLNYNYAYKGTKYLEETILELYKVKYDFDGTLTQCIYPILARRYNRKVSTIYGNIKQATRLMLKDCDESKLSTYFEDLNSMKPKIKDIIFAILNKL